MNLDIHSAVVMAVVVAAIGAVISLWRGLRNIRRGRKIAYYRMAQQQVVGGWRTLLLALLLLGSALVIGFYAEPVAYSYFPPSPTQSKTSTITLTPTISLTPTITLTPTETLTPAESYTPTITLTPFMPEAIEAQFTSSVTANPDSVFSPLTFSLKVDRAPGSFQAVDPQREFQQPLSTIYVTYTYNNMNDGVDWTALWYRGGELLKYETAPWEGGTGGSGQYTLDLPQEKWLPGTYQLIFFVGTEWKILGEFVVSGEPPTPTFTPTASSTPVPSLTPTFTRTPRPTNTRLPTDTRWPTKVK